MTMTDSTSPFPEVIYLVSDSFEGEPCYLWCEDDVNDEGNKYTLAIAEEECNKVKRYEEALNPRTWTREMLEAWHRNIPDIQKAFDALKQETKT